MPEKDNSSFIFVLTSVFGIVVLLVISIVFFPKNIKEIEPLDLVPKPFGLNKKTIGTDILISKTDEKNEILNVVSNNDSPENESGTPKVKEKKANSVQVKEYIAEVEEQKYTIKTDEKNNIPDVVTNNVSSEKESGTPKVHDDEVKQENSVQAKKYIAEVEEKKEKKDTMQETINTSILSPSKLDISSKSTFSSPDISLGSTSLSLSLTSVPSSSRASPSKFQVTDIDIIVRQTGCTKEIAETMLKIHEGDVINCIMALTH